MFKSMKTGFILLLLISLFASFIDLSNPSVDYSFIGFYFLVIMFVINLAIYVVNKLKKIIQLLKMRTESRSSLYSGVGLHLSLFAVHAGIALLFLGNILDLGLGYSQRVELRPGESFTLPGSRTVLRLEDFRIDYYQDGSPSQYTSKVLVTENDQEVTYDITVNHPLEISGSKIYQESYGWIVNIEIGDGNNLKKYFVKPGDEVGLENRKIEIVRYFMNFVPGKMPEKGVTGAPAVMYYMSQKNLTGVAKLGEKIKISDNQFLTFVDKQAFTVLKVKNSPGLTIVEVGGILLMIGIVLVFSFMHKKSMQFNDFCKDVAQ
ncbi:Cytochrome c biogenesis protein Ccs1 [Sporomusa acidovorans DSM 3132]|uniref:Cytochrome c biogenesis protein Ccs1 n=1 Tax=Sporomusa acidovorans (strain ATCC 49682 / DSM 3132 / Mol) TaxID=1123286 RepID=A0ABZ3J298_SPOA4|nr:cytochrome c biogenesis protein Ccs1 [Sporomusa acidovorans DSM 3132]SDE97025.1 cytochrome c biogenesis protein [Sporomusa acidovorans]